MPELNHTHDPARRSWVASANEAGCDLPIQNLPFASFRARGSDSPASCGIGIGDRILDVSRCASVFEGAARDAAQACASASLNALMALGPEANSALRAQLSLLLSEDATAGRTALSDGLVPLAAVDLQLPVRTRGYTDFFASRNHAANAGRLFRPDNPLLPNYDWVPVAYNGRANSIRISDAVQRPRGQIRVPESDTPLYLPSRRLDYETELAFYIGRPSDAGTPVAVNEAHRHLFGVSLLNDWSARDIQAWEYQPLGPFLGKSFLTTVGAWVVTAEALAPFHAPLAARPPGSPAPLPHLFDAADAAGGSLQIFVETSIRSQAMRQRGMPPHVLSVSDSATLYWTPAQMIAHQTSNGCAIDTGDLLGSGTISGESEDSLGSLLEITRGGKQVLVLPTGEERTFLADGDEVVMRGWCERPGHARIGFGECRSIVVGDR